VARLRHQLVNDPVALLVRVEVIMAVEDDHSPTPPQQQVVDRRLPTGSALGEMIPAGKIPPPFKETSIWTKVCAQPWASAMVTTKLGRGAGWPADRDPRADRVTRERRESRGRIGRLGAGSTLTAGRRRLALAAAAVTLAGAVGDLPDLAGRLLEAEASEALLLLLVRDRAGSSADDRMLTRRQKRLETWP
jgi:hypothetical protein